MKKLLFLSLGILLFPGLCLAIDYDLSDLTQFTGEAAGDGAGVIVSSAGDINGDGYDDILIGANGNDDAGNNAGAGYLIYGQATAFSSADLSTAVQFSGEAAVDGAGTSVASAGDVNGDGYDDILIGAIGNDDGGAGAGAGYLIYGQADDLESASLSTAVQFSGEAGSGSAGISVASAGDVNGDGYDDILIGATDVGFFTGAGYLIYGQADDLESASLSTAVKYSGEEENNMAGNSVASAGDVDGDGYDDILIGAKENDDTATDAGAGYLIYGQAAALESANLSTAVQFSGEAESDAAGTSVASAGDVNGDGYDDILIGAISNDDGGSGAGAGYLIYGQATALVAANLSTAVQFTGEAASDNAGYAVASAGDLDRDGYDDMLIGAVGNDDGGSGAGAGYLIFGKALDFSSVSLSTVDKFIGEAENDGAGASVSLAGDTNGDGFPEMIFGANANDDGGADAGAGYLGYLYIDADIDGVAGTTGILSGTDCDDTDALVSEDQTYYLDSDEDGYGSTTTTSICSSTAPTGYSTNSTDCDDADATVYENQSYYPDSDGDDLGIGDAESYCSATAPDGYADNANDPDDDVLHHAEYYDDDPAADDLHDSAITSVEGGKNGNIKVVYADSDTVYKYNIFNITETVKDVKVKQYRDTGYYIALHPRGKRFALFNVYNGERLKRQKINLNVKYPRNKLKIVQLQDRYFATAISKKDEKIRVFVAKILIGQEDFGKTAKFNLTDSKVIPKYTKKYKEHKLRLRGSKFNVRHTLMLKYSSKKNYYFIEK